MSTPGLVCLGLFVALTLSLGLGVGLTLRGSESFLPPLVVGECSSLTCSAPALRIEADPACVRDLYVVRGRRLVSTSGAVLARDMGVATWPMPCEGTFFANGGTFSCVDSLPALSVETRRMCVCGMRGKDGRVFRAEMMI